MISAIVFLPLLGAVLAGLIALFGAHLRLGWARGDGVVARIGDSDVLSVHDDGHALGGHEHPDHGENGADGHHDHDPAAAGSRPAEIITTGLLIVAAVLSWITFFSIGLGETALERVEVMRWITSGTLTADWAFRVDTLTAVMLVVVTSVSALVHVYSIGYMAHDPNRPRFFAYLSLFTFAMLMLVTSDNLIQLFFGWEGVGLASYLLIGFWFERPTANAAAIKAFVVNRVGDFGFALGIFAIFVVFDSVEFETIFANAGSVAGLEMHFLAWDFNALTVICVLLFIGAMGKSAQFLLHTWLPDAMEGPTPVSALIHAATMVTAGVFLVVRMSPLFELSPDALAFVAFIGATTAFFAATVGLVQNDIKRIIAYSTCSQLGYMFVALGMGAYSAGIFHLFTHAFFKALLFLGAGSVIHAVSDEQDIRNMGGLRSRIPFTYAMMVIGTLALTGFPLLSGYFSKDVIIETAAAGHNPFAMYALVLTVMSAALTSFYSWRLILLTFHGKPRASDEVMAHVHESPLVMTVPLALLAVGAIAAGFTFSYFFVGAGYEEFWKASIFTAAENEILEAIHHLPAWVPWLPTLMMAIGLLTAIWFYVLSPQVPRRLAATNDLLYRFLLNKWYFDEIYDRLLVRPAKWLARFLWRRGDGWLIDGFGPDGVSSRVLDVTRNVVRLQSGYIYHYAFAMLIGAALLITWMLFR